MAEAGADRKRSFINWRFIGTEKRRVNRLAFLLFWSILMYFLVKAYVVSPAIVTDASMQPALGKGGYYLVNRYIYFFTRPQRGDIVVFKIGAYDADEQVKRVVGLPGETIEIKAGGVYVNGRLLEEPYAFDKTFPDSSPVTVASDAYFVLGDTRWVREDSRDYGAVPLNNIVGKIKPDELFPFR